MAYSGLRWGEMAALSADRVDTARRRIAVDRQLVETRHDLRLGPPKSRRRRTTMYPARTPGGVDLAELVERRLGELGADDILFPSPRGRWPRRSNYRRNTFEPAAAAGWPLDARGRRAWSFHSLRHVFATWALAQPGARMEDVSRLMGHSTVRVTRTCTSLPTATCSSGSTGRRSRSRRGRASGGFRRYRYLALCLCRYRMGLSCGICSIPPLGITSAGPLSPGTRFPSRMSQIVEEPCSRRTVPSLGTNEIL